MSKFRMEIPAMPVDIILRLGLRPTEHFFGTSFRFQIIVYHFRDNIFCGMMDEVGGPSDKVTFIKKNHQKYVQMTRLFAETAAVEVIEKIVRDRLDNGNRPTKIKT